MPTAVPRCFRWSSAAPALLRRAGRTAHTLLKIDIEGRKTPLRAVTDPLAERKPWLQVLAFSDNASPQGARTAAGNVSSQHQHCTRGRLGQTIADGCGFPLSHLDG